MNDDKTTTKKTRRENGIGSITKKKTKRGDYVGAIWLRDPMTGELERKYVRAKTTAIVRDRLDALIQNSKSGKALTSNKVTVEQYLLTWLETHVKPNKAFSTYRGFEMHVRRYLIPSLGKIRLAELSGFHVQAALNAAQDTGLSPTSVKAINATLKTALTRAIKEGRYGLVFNVAKIATPPPQVDYDPHPLTPDQGIRLLNVVRDHRYEAAFYLALLEGLRRGEVAGLQWSEVHFALNALHVKGALQRVTGQGAVLMGVKSKKSKRTIPLLPVVAAALRRRQAQQQQERVAAGSRWRADEQFVFTSAFGHRIQPEELLRELTDALKLAGLPEIRFHDLRHSCARTLRALGCDIKTIQVILGHATSQITNDFYQHAGGLDAEVVAATQKMNDLFARSLIAAGNEPPSGEMVVQMVVHSGSGTIQ